MSKLHVLVDSTAFITPDMQGRYANLHVVPLTVMLGDQCWQEPALSSSELFRLVAASAQTPRTSQPSPGDFLAVLEPLVNQGMECLIVTLAGGLSGTVRSAATAASTLKGRPVYVVDSGTTAIGMVRMAETAFDLSAQGWSAAAIAGRLQAIAAVTYTLFVPDTLEYLHKGGRIGGASALLGTLLQIKPILYLTEGKVSVLDKVRTRSRALARMTEELEKYGPLAYIGVVHLEAEEEAHRLAETLAARYGEASVSVSTGGSVLGSHLGPGLVGVIFQQALA